MSAHNPKVDDMKADVTRFREGAVVRPLELFSIMKRSVASILKTTGDVVGALRHAPANSITFTDVTTLAHMPATHNTLYKDTYRKAGQRYESGEEDSGFEDGSGDDTSDGRVSPETSEELPAGVPLWRGQQESSS